MVDSALASRLQRSMRKYFFYFSPKKKKKEKENWQLPIGLKFQCGKALLRMLRLSSVRSYERKGEDLAFIFPEPLEIFNRDLYNLYKSVFNIPCMYTPWWRFSCHIFRLRANTVKLIIYDHRVIRLPFICDHNLKDQYSILH